MLSNSQVKKYLGRIKFRGKTDITLKTVSRLQKQHLLNIPFENLDIHYNIPIILNLNKLYVKIIQNKRGGFCFELNGLFHALLKTLGFDVDMISARVYNEKKNSFGKEFDHQAIILNIDNEKYIVDVGFGEFAVSPLKIIPDKIQNDKNGKFKFVKYNRSRLCIQRLIKKRWSSQYIFGNKSYRLEDFDGMCKYHSASPESSFTQKKVYSQMTAYGRITLTDDYIKITKHRKTTKIKISDRNKFENFLKKYFKANI